MTQYSGIFTMQQQAQALTSEQWCTDPYFKNTTLLLHADGIPSGSQNNTFLDSSSNSFAITRNGNTTQGSFSPYMPNGYWSNYFDGTTDYLTYSGTSMSGDFTVECWVYKTAVDASGYTNIFSDSTNNSQWCLDNTTPGSIGLYSGGWVINPSGAAITNGVWHHIVYAREGTTCRAYVDGVQQGTGTSSSTLIINRIGAYSAGGYEMNGYISNLRIVNGTCLYPSGTSFTPSTAPLTAITNTALLTCQSNRFIDNSTNAFAITAAGNTAVQQFQPFMRPYQYSTSVIGGSGYFDGSGDELYTPASGQFVAAGDFTISGWMYPTVTKSSSNYHTLVANYTIASSTDWGIYVNSSNQVEFYFGSATAIIVSSSTIQINAWSFISVVRSGSTVTMYMNGVSVGSATKSGTLGVANKSIYIGNQAGAATTYTQGYISDVRLVADSAITTVPTAPLTAVSGTSLLTNFTNAGIYDNSMQNNLETVGNAQVSTSVVKYGSGSLAFDGSGDYLNMLNSGSFIFRTGDFTVEFWMYVNALNATMYLVGNNPLSGNTAWMVELLSTGLVLAGGFTTNTTSTIAIPTGVWAHVAAVQFNGSLSVYINGVASGTAATGLNFTNAGSVYIGASPSGTRNFNGYIDDLRITNGVARYTSNFQPPQVAFANQ